MVASRAFPEIAETPLMAAADNPERLTAVGRFLRRFGYLKCSEIVPRKSADELIAALHKYQAFNSLPISGSFDEVTRNTMATLRCGMPDILPNVSDFSLICRWKRGNGALTYFLDNGTA